MHDASLDPEQPAALPAGATTACDRDPATAMLGPAEGRALLDLARAALRAHLEGREQPQLDAGLRAACGEAGASALAAARGAFVTWKRGRALRGCIGYLSAQHPLWQAVRELAVTAASRDPRFPAIAAHEWPELRCSISVLTEPRPIDASDVVVGRHGLIVERDRRRGVLLPQVPLEWGWDREAFLGQTCRKAGLDEHLWRDPGTRLLGFEAQIFAEPASPLGRDGGGGMLESACAPARDDAHDGALR